MRVIELAAFAAVILVSFCDAIYLVKRDGPPAVVGLQVEKLRDHVWSSDLERRAGSKTLSQTLDNNGNLYFANVTLGTPPQPVRLQIDTGSSETWVNVPTSSFCGGKDRNCSVAGTFNPKASRTINLVNHDFKIRYGDNTGGSGDYVTDDLHIAGQELKGVQFGLGLVSSTSRGLIGLGYPIAETLVENKGGSPFPNLPQILKNEGLTNSEAYSLWLNDPEANHGSILFGGVDSAKFHGNLTTVPVEKYRGQLSNFFVNLTNLYFNNATGGSQFASAGSILPVPVLLDSGSSMMVLPAKIVHEIYHTLKVLIHGDEIPVVDSGLGQETSTLDFTFTTAKVSVPMSELVLPIPPDQHGNETPLCRLGITYAAKPTSTLILCDTFLRSAYVVYDRVNNEISIAPTKFNAVDSNIVEIGGGDKSDVFSLPRTVETTTTRSSC